MLALGLIVGDESPKLLHEYLSYEKFFVNKTVIPEAILNMWKECLNRSQYVFTYLKNSSFTSWAQLIGKGEIVVLVLFLGTYAVRVLRNVCSHSNSQSCFLKGKSRASHLAGLRLVRRGFTCRVSWRIRLLNNLASN